MKQFAKKIGSLPMEGNPNGTVHILARCEGKEAGAIEISPVDCVANELWPDRDHSNHQYKIAKEWHFSLVNNIGGFLSLTAPHYVVEGHETTFETRSHAQAVADDRDDFRWRPVLTVTEFENEDTDGFDGVAKEQHRKERDAGDYVDDGSI
jgi:hypothetical protein